MYQRTDKDFKISVPATSANIGVGFDTLGIAFKLYNHFTFKRSENFMISGCDKKYMNEDNLVIQSYKHIFDILNKEYLPVSVNIDANIPVSRGLGSSATCIIAGVLSANHYLGYPLTKDECLYHISTIEGHPDNVTPALIGKLTSAFMDDKVYYVSHDVSSKLKFVALIPNFELSTSKARSVLPASLEYHDAINNISRVDATIKGLENGDMKLLKAAIKDRLHEPYRRSLIKGFDVIAKMTDDNSLIYLSGAGPTIMAIFNDESLIDEFISKLPQGYCALRLEVDDKGVIIHE